MSDDLLAKMAIECVQDSRRWFPGAGQSIAHHTLSLCGEAGELANLVKKIERGSLKLDDASTKNALSEEMADVLIYLLNIAGLMRVDLRHVYEYKRAKNEQRFGKGKNSAA